MSVSATKEAAGVKTGRQGSQASKGGRAPAQVEAKPDRLAFLRAFFKNPKQLGACFPSSPQLRRAQVEGLGLERAKAVAELGAGPGTTTQDILGLIPREAKFFAVELNPLLAGEFRRRLPGVKLYEDDAIKLRRFAAEQGVQQLDFVITSLPWMLFEPELQDNLMREIHAALRPGGKFTMITYRYPGLPRVNRFFRSMRTIFSHAKLHKYVAANIPPTSVYVATK